MNFLTFSIEPNLLQVVQKNLKQETLAETTIPFETFTLATTLQEISTKILTDFTEYQGGIFNTIPESFYSTHKNSTLLNTSLEALVKTLSEKLNIPILTQEEAQAATDLTTAFQNKKEELTWNLDYYGYTPGKEEYSVESLLTIGNGFMGLRGTLPEMTISDDYYPATYIAGLYNTEESTVAGQIVENEDFVNTTNSQYISFKIEETADWFHVEQTEIETLHRNLNLKNGLFTSTMIVSDKNNHRLKVTAQKIVNMAKMNNYSIKYTIEPLNFSKKIAVKTMVDGKVYNYNVERYRNLTQTHTTVTAMNAKQNTAQMEIITNNSKIAVSQKTSIQGNFFAASDVQNQQTEKAIEQVVEFFAEEGQAYTLEKHVQVTASIAKESWEKPSKLNRTFEEALNESQKAWESLWQTADIQLSGDMMSQKLLRIHTYHLLVSASPFSNKELDVSITARGLHGEAYRGHIFWDEIFILPFYIMHFPETAKQILMYRYNRLGKAKENALESQYEGAMFPWQSGLDGSEDTQKLHLNPLNGEWGEDHSILQRHVSLAIAYNVWMYWNSSKDDAFMKQYGAELLLEIANFWRSAATFDEKTGRYYIDKVMGPDEFHEAYPDAAESGLKNNAYTNLMTVWLFEELENVLDLLSTEEKNLLFEKTGTTPNHLDAMKKIRTNLSVEINEEGIIAQYEGYFDLKEIDWTAAREKYGNIYRMDRILKADGKSPDDYKVAKQADTLMLFYNLNKTKIDEILADLGYQLPENYLEKNLLYYLERTSHGSTLSRIVHAQLAEDVAFHDLSWTLYQEALYSDYQDIQGGTTAEGIHTGVMAATIYVTLTTYAGVDLKEKLLTIQPNLPQHWNDMKFNLTHRGINYSLNINQNTVTILASEDTDVRIKETVYSLKANNEQIITY